MDEAFEFKLGKFAEEINESIGKSDGADIPKNASICSIFLRDNRRDAYVLRASSDGSTFLGKAKLNTTEENYQRYKEEKTSVGLTPTAIFSKEPLCCHDPLKEDPRCSQYELNEKRIVEYEKLYYCEYKVDEIKSLIVVPIIYSTEIDSDPLESPPAGVIRVVRSKLIDHEFTKNDIKKLQNLIDINAPWIRSSVFLSQLIELGTYTNLPDLCSQAAIILKDLLNAKGCSIFLLDEKGNKDSERVYKCFGTTGLMQRGQKETIKNPLEEPVAWYKFDPNVYPKSADPLNMPLTVGVIRARMPAFLDEITDTEVSNQFTSTYKITRKPKTGKVSEYYWEDDDRLQFATGKMLFAPMFFGDPDDPFVDVLGVVRIARTDKCEHFETTDRHMFVSIVERLAEAVKLAKLVQFINNLATLNDYQILFNEVVANIPKFIGATDCALLILKENKLFRKAEWKKGFLQSFDEDKDFYDIKDETRRGFTGYVAFNKLPLMFNNEKELQKKYGDYGGTDKPTPSGKTEEPPLRFLGFPIVSSDKVLGDRVLGVLRICKKDDKTPRFTNKDLRALEMIAKRLQPRLEAFHRDQQAKEGVRNIFSRILEDKIKNMKFITCKERIVQFFDKIESDLSMVDTIIGLQKDLFEFYRPDDQFPLRLFKNFDMFNKNILPDVPRYRDHFIHQMVVFLIGIVIIDGIYDYFIDYFIESYPSTTVTKIDKNDITGIRKEIEKAWLITALFHDIAYPLESIDKWINNIVGIFLQSQHNICCLSLPLDGILFDNKYLDSIDRLVGYHEKILKRDDKNLRHKVIELLKGGTHGLDHGIISALLLLGESRFNKDDILPSASAIALHNKLMFKEDIARISLEHHPLAFLLIFCDLLHEWGRETFTQVNDTRKLPRLINLVKVPDPKPAIRAHIVLTENDEDKIAEVERVFSRLNFNAIDFYIQVNEALIPT